MNKKKNTIESGRDILVNAKEVYLGRSLPNRTMNYLGILVSIKLGTFVDLAPKAMPTFL